MAVHLYLAPAGRGKTAYALECIRQAHAAVPLASIAVILPNQAQVSAFRHRLGAGGGALGASVGTFYTLYPEILAWARQLEPRLPEATQYRLLRNIVARLADEGRLHHYAPLRDKPGFVAALHALIEELKRSRVHRDAFQQAIQALDTEDIRLAELADIYSTYQDWLLDHGWVDIEGQGWLAASAMERQPGLGRHLRLLLVDGFDEFNPTQLSVLKLLAGRAAETIITLTGTAGQAGRPRPALRRFSRALHAVSLALALEPEPLPDQIAAPYSPALAHLEANLFEPGALPVPAEGAVALLEAQNRAEEARAALRWLKARLVRDHMAPGEVALLARDLPPYRPFIEEAAAEFGLALHLREGLNLAANPTIAALLSLLALPVNGGDGDWAYRPLLDTWRSPYFEEFTSGVTARAAQRLDLVARQGLVLRGLDQWRAALAQAVSLAQADRLPLADEDMALPGQLTQAEVSALQDDFEAFVARITPPAQATLRDYAAFVEDIIGDDPKLAASFPGKAASALETGAGSGMVGRAWAVAFTAPRDIAALRAFKDVLRGLVLAETLLDDRPALSYPQFYEELRSAVQAATYTLPAPESQDAALPVLSVLNARGLSFRAVALVGLAEGDFPRPEREDILLREEDRRAIGLESRLRGDEITFFYQAVTRAREKLLLCRPYLANDGQPWEPSLYWREVSRQVAAPAEHVRPEDPLPLAQVASPQEFARALAQSGLARPDLAAGLPPADIEHVLHSADVLRARLAPASSVFEGDLTRLAGRLATVYGTAHVWSSSRLEAYGLCPLHFWLWQDLALEARQPPQEGFDVFILGSMYHKILEGVYRQAGAQADADHLLEILPAVAQQVFDAAPATYGFRPTALWEAQRRELEQIIAQTLTALAEVAAGNAPMVQEQAFGMRGQPPLVVQSNGEELRVRGFIDRVDRQPDGRLCIIDYKSGSTPISRQDLAEGRRLQIALYALAARDALALGDVADGFYWHIGSAQASNLKLNEFEGGIGGALNMAVDHAFQHVAGIRAGHFPPLPPRGGCPGHCPGASFCWQYKAKGW
jgi:ATP-dependent helicase/nuclease subunit B